MTTNQMATVTIRDVAWKLARDANRRPATRKPAECGSLPESEGRVLLLINAFSGTADKPRQLEGRLKLAKLDFLVRYPKYLARVLVDRNVSAKAVESVAPEPTPLEDKMIRYRYGPWDPSYYAVLGSLIGRGLVEPIPFKHGIGYRVTNRGRDLATAILEDETWDAVNRRRVRPSWQPARTFEPPQACTRRRTGLLPRG